MRVLLIEDDTACAAAIALMLKSEGLVCDSTALGEDGLELARLYDYDLIVLDLILPDMDGYDVLRRLRTAKVLTLVLILSGLGTAKDRIKGLEMGADDFLAKPFDRRELVARIRAVVRRSNGHPDSAIHIGKLSVNLNTRTVRVGDRTVDLTGKQFDVLALLALRKGVPLTKEAFLNHLYGGMDEPDQKIVDVFICKLRQKLSAATGGDTYIETVWGHGYVMRDPRETSTAKDGRAARRTAA